MTATAARKITATCAILGVATIGIAAAPKQANAWWNGYYGGVYVPPPVVVAPPPPAYYPAPAYYAPPRPARAWIPGHWRHGYWIPGHWG